MQNLVARWLTELQPDGWADLSTGLDRFPELRDALIPAGFRHRVEADGESVLVATDDGISMSLIVHFISPLPADANPHLRTGHVDIDVDPSGRVMLIHTLDTPPALHRQQLGRRIVENLADLGRALGLAELHVDASKIGRWAWARWGFEWMDDSDRDRVLAAAAEFARALGRSVDLSAIERPSDFATLTDLISSEDIRAAGGPSIDGDRPVALGKALILGPPQERNHWLGRLHL